MTVGLDSRNDNEKHRPAKKLPNTPLQPTAEKRGG
jgi:hypothetical protein